MSIHGKMGQHYSSIIINNNMFKTSLEYLMEALEMIVDGNFMITV